MTATADAAKEPDGAPPIASVTAVVGVLVMFELVSGFLQAGIAPILPAIADLHGVSDSAVTLVVAVQLLASAVCAPAFGRLGDLYGHRRMLRIALVSTAIGSVLVAAAPNFVILLIGRFLQGALVALLPLEISLVRDRLPVDLARRAIARLVAALVLGGLLGAVGMGVAVEAFGDVRVALAIPAVLAVICVPVSMAFVPESVTRATGRIDLPGIALLGLGVVGVLAGVTLAAEIGWGNAGTLGALGAGLVLLAAWTVMELRVREPLVDLRAMAGRHVAPYYFASFAFGIIYFGSQSPNSTFMATDPDEAGYGFGMSALGISMVMLPALLASMVASAGAPRIAAKIGYRVTLIASFGLVAAGSAWFVVFHEHVWQLAGGLVVAALGMGAALSAMPTVIAEASDPAHTGVSTALYNNVKTVGGGVAGGAFGTVLATAAGSENPSEGSYMTVWVVCALFAFLAAALAYVAGSGKQRA
ncbi:MFS transporter [Actinomadura sp. CNU-125]|uniref:MFS transporter n=1 Tax=Actinomadura sp. CNU-125 TaxID=1904961 RepID=UPI000962D876|nr:MFS transporter [Actinomadura sp. CNU-125]OLT12334.1 MFS transporter [Actinomadura sp. CNU-125]